MKRNNFRVPRQQFLILMLQINDDASVYEARSGVLVFCSLLTTEIILVLPTRNIAGITTKIHSLKG